jgi:hypothetical protein
LPSRLEDNTLVWMLEVNGLMIDVRHAPVNPIYTGVGPFPRMVEDDAWVRARVKLIEEEGTEQFLVNLLFTLRECFLEE